MEERHFAKMTERIELGQHDRFLRFVVFVFVADYFALAIEHDPQIAAVFVLANDHFARRKTEHLGDVGKLPAFGLVEAAENRRLLQNFNQCRIVHVMPPKIVARPTRPMPSI